MKYREHNGRFRKKLDGKPLFILFVVIAIVGAFLIQKPITYEAIPVVSAIDTSGAKYEKKIKALKQEVLDTLAQCETQGVKEPDAAIILDSNDKMSIGKYMYQITTVQHYVKLFYNKDISRQEAIVIAVDANTDIPIDELTEKIIFEDEKGIGNWHNCNKKHNLSTEIEIIKKLTF